MGWVRWVLLPSVLLLTVSPSVLGASAAAAKGAPPPVPCLLMLNAANPITCYPASAATKLQQLGLHATFNPVPTVKELTHLRLRQVMNLGPPRVFVVDGERKYDAGIYFPFGKYVHPDVGIPAASPRNPRWLVLIEGARLDAPDSVVLTGTWYARPNPYSSPTDVQTVTVSARQGHLSFIAISNEPVPLLRKLVLALIAARG